ncbi:MAG TPA: Na/Pi cotransporter family protein [Candidatus Bathyarchaeota archaeon]|nr:Na/Pi cotransporter family protein [Candidatus Bathyarchaeota archaeon]
MRYKNLIFVLISFYFFVASIVLIKDSIVLVGLDQVQTLVNAVDNTLTGVFAGWFGTALLQSSGAFDSVIIAFVSVGAMPVSIAVATIIGAEIGTTVTTQLVAVVGYFRHERKRFRTSFSVAMLHYWYNFCTLLLFFSVEYFFHTLTYVAEVGSTFFSRIPGLMTIPSIFMLISPWVDILLEYIPAWLGFVAGCGLLLLSLKNCEKYLSATFAGEVSGSLIRSTFGSTTRAFLAGLLFTILVPSTSVMISMIIPLFTTGVIDKEKYILPYILGANIGTVFDVMIAALATGNPAAIGVWLVHLTINVVGALIFLPLAKPFSSSVNRINEFITFSKKRTTIFLVLSNAIPAILLIVGILY